MLQKDLIGYGKDYGCRFMAFVVGCLKVMDREVNIEEINILAQKCIDDSAITNEFYINNYDKIAKLIGCSVHFEDMVLNEIEDLIVENESQFIMLSTGGHSEMIDSEGNLYDPGYQKDELIIKDFFLGHIANGLFVHSRNKNKENRKVLRAKLVTCLTI